MKRQRQKNSELKEDQKPPLARKRGRPARATSAVQASAAQPVSIEVGRAATPAVPSSPAPRPASVAAMPLSSSAFFRPFDFSPSRGLSEPYQAVFLPSSASDLPGLTPSSLFEKRWPEFQIEPALLPILSPQFDQVAPEIVIPEGDELYSPSLLSIEVKGLVSVSESSPRFSLSPRNSDGEIGSRSSALVQTSSGDEAEEECVESATFAPSPF